MIIKGEVSNHGTEKKIAKQPKNSYVSFIEDGSPYTRVYRSLGLPQIIKDCLESFNSDSEQRIFLTGFLSSVSSIFPTLYGLYSGKKTFCNLYAMIIAPAGSGKSVMNEAVKLVKPIHSFAKIEANNPTPTDFKTAKGSKRKGNPMLIASGDVTKQALIINLRRNPKGLLIVESEIDTVSKALKGDHGGHSDILRKAFEFETISSIRVTENEHLEVDNPRLSVLLSGTPGQVRPLFQSTEDGLISRFIFQVEEGEEEWKDAFDSEEPISDKLKPIAKKLLELHEKALEKPIEFELKEHQKKQLNKLGRVWLEDAKQYQGAQSIAKRLANILFRESMIFSMLRQDT